MLFFPALGTGNDNSVSVLHQTILFLLQNQIHHEHQEGVELVSAESLGVKTGKADEELRQMFISPEMLH